MLADSQARLLCGLRLAHFRLLLISTRETTSLTPYPFPKTFAQQPHRRRSLNIRLQRCLETLSGRMPLTRNSKALALEGLGPITLPIQVGQHPSLQQITPLGACSLRSDAVGHSPNGILGFGQPASTGFGSNNAGGSLFGGNSTNTNTGFGGRSTVKRTYLASDPGYSTDLGTSISQRPSTLLF